MYLYPEADLAQSGVVQPEKRTGPGSERYKQIASSQPLDAGHSVFKGYIQYESDVLGHPFSQETQKSYGMGINSASNLIPGFNKVELKGIARPLRVGHLNAALLPAGIETWFGSLIRHCNPQLLEFWRHVSTTPVVDTRVVRRLGIPVEIGAEESCRHLALHSDVLLISDPGLEPARVASWFSGVPMPLTIFIAHGDGGYTAESLKAFRPLVDHVVAISDHVRQEICTDTACSVILNGVNPETLCRTQPRHLTRENLGFSETDFVVGIVGRFSPEKNMAMLAEAVAKLPSHVKLLLVGFGYLRDELLSYAMQLLPGRFVMLEGDRFLGDLYAAMDTHVLPSSCEGYGLVTMEAMMCGLPVIATNLGVARELIEHGVNGLIVQQDPTDIAEKIDCLRRNNMYRSTMGALGRATAETHGFSTTMARQYEQLITKLWLKRQSRQSSMPVCDLG